MYLKYVLFVKDRKTLRLAKHGLNIPTSVTTVNVRMHQLECMVNLIKHRCYTRDHLNTCLFSSCDTSTH